MIKKLTIYLGCALFIMVCDHTNAAVFDYVQIQRSAHEGPPKDKGGNDRTNDIAHHEGLGITAVVGTIGWPEIRLSEEVEKGLVRCITAEAIGDEHRRREIPRNVEEVRDNITANTKAAFERCTETSDADLSGFYQAAYVALYDANGSASKLLLIPGGAHAATEGLSVAFNANGSKIYIAGKTKSQQFPSIGTRAEDVDTRSAKPSYDGFVMQLDTDLNIQWSTRVGGGAYDDVRDIVIDSHRVIAIGTTHSSDLVQSTNSLKGNRDGFITVINHSGRIQSSRYLGGDGQEQLSSGILSGNNLYLVGVSSSSSIKGVKGYSRNNNGGNDGIVLMLDDNYQLVTGTFIGGSSNDALNTILLSPQGDIIAGGMTRVHDTSQLSGFPAPGGLDHSFVLNHEMLRLNPIGDIVREEISEGNIRVDVNTNVRGSITDRLGHTVSRNKNPVASTNAIQSNNAGGSYDGMLVKFSADLTNLRYLSFLGGSAADRITGMAWGEDSDLVIVGDTLSEDFPVSEEGVYRSLQGPTDGYIVQLSSDMTEVHYATYAGGDRADDIRAIVSDSKGILYIAGSSRGCGFSVLNTRCNKSTGISLTGSVDNSADGFFTRVIPNSMGAARLRISFESSHESGVVLFEDTFTTQVYVTNQGPNYAINVKTEIDIPTVLDVDSIIVPDDTVCTLIEQQKYQCVTRILSVGEPLTITVVSKPNEAADNQRINVQASSDFPSRVTSSLRFSILGPLEFYYGDFELTQGIQDLKIISPSAAARAQNIELISEQRRQGSMPLVAGKATALRVFLRGTRSGQPYEIPNVTGELRAYRNNIELPGGPLPAITQNATFPAIAERKEKSHSLNFILFYQSSGLLLRIDQVVKT